MMVKQSLKRSGQIAMMALLPLFMLWGSLVIIEAARPSAVQAARGDAVVPRFEPAQRPAAQICDCSGDVYDCENFADQEAAQACFEYCRKTTDEDDLHQLDQNGDGEACEETDYESLSTGQEESTPPGEEPTAVPTEEVPGSNNLVFNGNFEFGFYTVPELGFEPPEVGHVPNNWNWFKNEKHGKYNIYDNAGFGLVCPDDLSQGTTGKNSLSLHIQSTDESDARLGVYQTIDVTPGQDYLFSISGTIQVQPGGSSPDINHRVLVYFDQAGNTDWRAIPHEDWTALHWREQELEFKLSGPDDPDIAKIEDYYEVVKAKSNKLTIFLMGWRRWANWRTGIFTLDCVSLIPLDEADIPGAIPRMSEISVTTVDEALEAGAEVEAGAAPQPEPAVVPGDDTGDETAGADQAIIPPSGGILETSGNALLVGAAAIILILGLVGAGIWNARRHR
ncbi:MAG: hypothetical protein AB1801_16275 [Chloroflexota bacterium]